MPYITSIERLGRKEGFLSASQKHINEVLKARFGEEAEKVIDAVKKINSVGTLDTLFLHALRASTLEEFIDIIEKLQ